MIISEFIEKTGFAVLCEGDGERTIEKKIYCCDLLSYCMTKSPTDGVWVTVMGNANVIAVATLTDVAVVIIADGTEPEELALAKAKQHDVTVLKSSKPVYETAVFADSVLSQ